MKLIDTHCHLDFPDFNKDRPAVIQRARENGIAGIINVGSTLEGCRRTLEFVEQYDCIYGAVGIHPHGAASVDEAVIGTLREMAAHAKVVGIGEVGLDFYRDLSPRDDQKRVFQAFIGLSQELTLPLIIHSRSAMQDVIAMLKSTSPHGAGGVFHCFSGDVAAAREVVELGFYISLGGSVTFRNAERARDVARYIPVDRLLLETDAPFLAPQRLRGKRNEPAYLIDALTMVADLKDISPETLSEITTENAQRLFTVTVE